MRKRDSSGPARGKRGASRQERSSGRPTPSGKPRTSSRRSDEGPSSGNRKFDKDSKPPFRKFDKGPSSRRADEKPFAGKPKFDKRPSSGKSDEGSFERKRRFDKDSTKAPFRKFDKGQSSRRSDEKPFEGKKRFEKDDTKPTFRKFDKDSSTRRSGEGSFEKRARPDKDLSKPPYRKFDKDPGKRTPRAFDKSDDRGDRKKKFTKSGGEGFSAKPPRKGEEGESKPRGFFNKQSSGRVRPRKYTAKKDEKPTINSQTGKYRLNRYIANSGVCSRREADELIKMGLVSVNGNVITEMGFQVDARDEVRYEGRVLRAEKPVYVLMNKPKGYLTTTKDPQERNTVMHIIGNAVKERVYPVGRLDRNTTGLLLFTNDGDLADKLSHPSYNVKKIYKVELDRPLAKSDFQKILDGIQLEEGRAMVDDLAIVSDDGKTVGIELHIGWNRVVRRIFERLEYTVVKLDRSVYAGLDKKDLPRGQWRFLTQEEIIRLKHFK